MMLDRTTPTIEQLLDDADVFRRRIEIEIEHVIADVDPASPCAADCRAMLREIMATLPECSLTHLMKVAVLDAAMNGACVATIKATLRVIGPAPSMLPVASASEVLEIFSPMIADLQRGQLH